MPYRLIVFCQGEVADPYLDMLEEQGKEAVINALVEHAPFDGEVQEDPFWGTSDDVYTQDSFHL